MIFGLTAAFGIGSPGLSGGGSGGRGRENSSYTGSETIIVSAGLEAPLKPKSMSLRLVDGVSSFLLPESTLKAMLLKTIDGSFGRLVSCLVSRRILKLRKTTRATRSTFSEADTESVIIKYKLEAAFSLVEMDPTVESKTKRLFLTVELISGFLSSWNLKTVTKTFFNYSKKITIFASNSEVPFRHI